MPTDEEINKILESHLEDFMKILSSLPRGRSTTVLGQSKTELAQVLTTVALYQSSNRLEKLTQALIHESKKLTLLTIVLITLTLTLTVLTGYLIWH
jgi:hypothetical protein